MVQVPAPTSETVDPVTVQTPPLPAPAAKLTGRCELATAATVYAGPPATAGAGGVELMTIACGARPIVNDCCARASLYLGLPAWWASTTQVPLSRNETVEPESLQMSFLPPIESLTGSPELALAAAVYAPPTSAEAGASDVNSTACETSVGAGAAAGGVAGAAAGAGGRGFAGAGAAGAAAAGAAGAGADCALTTGALASTGSSGTDAVASSPATTSPSETTPDVVEPRLRAAAP